MTCVEEALEWAQDQAELLSVDDVETLLARVGRTSAPSLFAQLWEEQCLSDQAVRLVGMVWSMDEFPEQSLERATWRALFAEAGYTVDAVAAERPSGTIRLYRGSVSERRDGWSWSDSRHVAEKYAQGGLGGRLRGEVWTSLVPSSHILARNDHRDEHEYVVDTRGLVIAPAT